MRKPEILLIPNLLSLSRILLTPLVGYFLWRNDPTSTVVCVLLLILAGITDVLDGYFARRMHSTSPLGLILDPLADKVFAAVLVVELILFRDFPVWLAAAIVGRDLLIVIAGLVVLGRKKVAMSSTLTGKYAFFSIVILIGFSVINFESGVKFVAIFTLMLLAASLVIYARALMRVMRGEEISPFVDRPIFKATRLGTAIILLAVCVVLFVFEEFLGRYPLPW